MEIQKIAVIGLGYIGLPTAAVLASKGLKVVGVDVKSSTVDAVNRGEVPFVEPDLGFHVAGAVKQGNLSASIETPKADAYIVAVPTPFLANHTADLSYIDAAARGIAPQLEGGELIILESTSPPGATRHLGEYLISLRPDLSLDSESGENRILVAHCPERVLPGRVMIELVSNDRIIGGITHDAAIAARDLYSKFCQGQILLTDDVTAEMAKLVENSFRDVNIAFANELSVISSKMKIDVWELISLANHHPRVNILQPGPGVGGHCIAVDPWFIVAEAPEEARLIRTAREVNDAKPVWVVNEVLAAVKKLSPSAEIAVLGLAFKANIDDLRESPSISIALDLSDKLPGHTFNVVEPFIDSLPPKLANRLNLQLMDSTTALKKSDVVVLLVDHDEFARIPADALSGKIIIDTRGVLPKP